MIGYLEGKVKIKRPDGGLVISVNGVGYVVYVSKDLLNYLNLDNQSPSDETISLFIETKVRENDITLYGFRTQNELMWFNRLMGVQGVGGKVALNVISLGVVELNSAIYNREISVLTMADGVGKKGAERIIADLAKYAQEPEDKVSELLLRKEVAEGAIKALMSLGYSKREAEFNVKTVMTDLAIEQVDKSKVVQSALLLLGS